MSKASDRKARKAQETTDALARMVASATTEGTTPATGGTTPATTGPTREYLCVATKQRGAVRFNPALGDRSQHVFSLRPPYAHTPAVGSIMTLAVATAEMQGHTLYFDGYMYSVCELVYRAPAGAGSIVLTRTSGPVGMYVDGVPAPMLVCSLPMRQGKPVDASKGTPATVGASHRMDTPAIE